MKGTTIKQALQFIQTAGVPNLVSGIRTGMVPPEQVRTALRAVGTAIDRYVETEPLLSDLRRISRRIGHRSPTYVQETIAHNVREWILGQLTIHRWHIESAVLFALRVHGGWPHYTAPYDLGPEWRWIPPGEFQMGSPEDDPWAYDDEKSRPVVTGGGYLHAHPMTNAESRALHIVRGQKNEHWVWPRLAGDDQPVVDIDHKKAKILARWMGEEVSRRMGIPLVGRLPTEAEWEKAAKGRHRNQFIEPATPRDAHILADTTRPVNHPDAKPNSYGLKDMIGNVSEWTSSRGEREGTFVFRSASYSIFHGDLRMMRAAFRVECGQYHSFNFLGLRPWLEPKKAEG